MEGNRFDSFTRALGRKLGRRGALGTVAAGVAVLGGATARQAADAKHGKNAKPDKTAKAKVAPAVACKPGQTKCGKQCVSLQTNAKNCGACKNACLGDQVCGNGTCVSKCGQVTKPASYDFEKDLGDWHGPLTRVKSAKDGIKAYQGKWYATMPAFDENADDQVFTRWGAYGYFFPEGGFTTSAAIYLDIEHAPNTAAMFSYTSAANQPNCNHRRDFVYSVGVDTAASEPTFCVSASNNAPGDPCAGGATRVTATGWYVFKHLFRSDNGVLAVDFVVTPPSGDDLQIGTRSDPSDVIGQTVGGNRYSWFVRNDFETLAIDATSRVKS